MTSAGLWSKFYFTMVLYISNIDLVSTILTMIITTTTITTTAVVYDVLSTVARFCI